MRRLLVILVKFGISAGLLIFLFTDLQRSDPETFSRLQHSSPRWPVLLLGWTCLFGALLAGIVRWRAILTALGVPTRWAPVLRYSVYGYALDFAALGTVGGDLFKALALARPQAEHRPLILASVMIDRIIGLHSLLTIAAVVAISDRHDSGGEFSPLHVLPIAAALAGNALLLLLWLIPGLGSILERWARRCGRIGEAAAAVLISLHRIKQRPLSMMPALATSVAVVFLHVSGHFLVAQSLPGAAPTFAEQWRIVPVAMLSAVIPLPGGTLGALDFAMSFLYLHATDGRVALGQGLLVTMIARVASIAMVAIAGVLFLADEVGSDRHA